MKHFDPFPCYLHHIAVDRLKSHTPFPCPASQLIYIFLKFHCVFRVLNFSVASTIINEESYFRINVCLDIINVQRKQQGTKDSALWDTRQNWGPIRFCSVYTNTLLSVTQKRICPFQCLPTYATAKQFALKELMRWGVKCFLKIKNECINLSSIVQDFSPIIQGCKNAGKYAYFPCHWYIPAFMAFMANMAYMVNSMDSYQICLVQQQQRSSRLDLFASP